MLLSHSPSPTNADALEVDQIQTPQIPPRIKTPQTQEAAQQSSQLDIHQTLSAKRVHHSREFSIGRI